MNRPAPLKPIAADLLARRPFRVGAVTFDPVSRDATWPGGKERLQPQSFKVLALLAARRGEVVTRQELVELCWGGRIVGEDVLNRSILLLRHFADRAGGFAIETIPRAGYRLVERPTAGPWRRQWKWLAPVAAIASVSLALLFHEQPGNDRATLSVMVMPFTTDQGALAEPQLASSARESVIRMLSDSGVSVAIPNDSKGQMQPAADLVISGDVRGTSDNVNGTIRVEDARRHAIVLSHRLAVDRKEAADLPDQMGANLAAALSWTGRLIRRDEAHPSDPAFVTQLLELDSNEEADLWHAFEFERRNAPNAPGSELAQFELAYDTGMLVRVLPDDERMSDIADARAATDRARHLDPQFGDANIPWCTLHPLVWLRKCEDHLRAALAVDPQAAFIPHFLSRLMDNVGRRNEALSLAASAYSEDKYAPSKIAHLIEMFEAVGDTPTADRLYQSGIRLWPDFHFIFRLRSEGIAERGDFVALYRFEQRNHARLPPFYDSALTLAAAVNARSLPGVRAACPKTSIDLKIAECMLGFAQLGDLDDAFAYADLVYPRRRGASLEEDERLWLRDPFNLDTSFLTGAGAVPMRRDPRYMALAERLGLLDYWRSTRLPDFCTRAHETICQRISKVSH